MRHAEKMIFIKGLRNTSLPLTRFITKANTGKSRARSAEKRTGELDLRKKQTRCDSFSSMYRVF